MDEIVRGAATHDGGLVKWLFVTDDKMPTDEFAASQAQPIYDEIDRFVMDHPGYRVIIAIEREEP